MLGKCLACGFITEVDKAHIKTKKSGGTMDDWNIMLLCRRHHVEQHKIGIATFVTKYRSVEIELKNKGWEVQEIFGQRKLLRV